MKKLKIEFYYYTPNVISFTNYTFSFDRLSFLIEKDFETITDLGALSKAYYLNLNNILNLKQFKIEIS